MSASAANLTLPKMPMKCMEGRPRFMSVMAKQALGSKETDELHHERMLQQFLMSFEMAMRHAHKPFDLKLDNLMSSIKRVYRTRNECLSDNESIWLRHLASVCLKEFREKHDLYKSKETLIQECLDQVKKQSERMMVGKPNLSNSGNIGIDTST